MGRGGGRVSDSGIRACQHFCSRFVLKGCRVYTQVDLASFRGLPCLAIAVPTESWEGAWEQGWFQKYKYAKVYTCVTRSWDSSMRLCMQECD